MCPPQIRSKLLHHFWSGSVNPKMDHPLRCSDKLLHRISKHTAAKLILSGLNHGSRDVGHRWPWRRPMTQVTTRLTCSIAVSVPGSSLHDYLGELVQERTTNTGLRRPHGDSVQAASHKLSEGSSTLRDWKTSLPWRVFKASAEAGKKSLSGKL